MAYAPLGVRGISKLINMSSTFFLVAGFSRANRMHAWRNCISKQVDKKIEVSK